MVVFLIAFNTHNLYYVKLYRHNEGDEQKPRCFSLKSATFESRLFCRLKPWIIQLPKHNEAETASFVREAAMSTRPDIRNRGHARQMDGAPALLHAIARSVRIRIGFAIQLPSFGCLVLRS